MKKMYVVWYTFYGKPRQRKVARYHWAVLAENGAEAIAVARKRAGVGFPDAQGEWAAFDAGQAYGGTCTWVRA